MIVGVVHDPQFGPVLACGAGGVLVELLKDVSVRLTPLAAPDAEEMVRELKTYPLLTGYRGAPVPTYPHWWTRSCASGRWWRSCRRSQSWT